MQLKAPLGIFGGTFDPIHNGHIFPIIEAAKHSNIQSVALMPNFLPSHKQQTHSSAEHRLAMVKLVCQQFPLFYPEPYEIEQASVSYSVDTLRAFRQRFPTTPLCFFIGSDSLYSLPTWHRWQELLSLCHFIVCQRKTNLADNRSSVHWQTVQNLLTQHQTYDPQMLQQQLAGKIYLADTSQVPFSSTEIRTQLAQHQLPENALPRAIYQYIEQYKLYQPPSNF